MKLTEISLPNTIDDAYIKLSNSGYEFVNRGSYGMILQKPGLPYVVKLFSSSDEAYKSFLKVISSTTNIHFPKIYGKMIKINERYNAVRIEPLSPLPSTGDMRLSAIYGYMKFYNSNKKDIDPGLWEEIIRSRYWMNNNPELKEACDLLIKTLGQKYNLDLKKDNNVMLRGNEIVLTDPYNVKQSTFDDITAIN